MDSMVEREDCALVLQQSRSYEDDSQKVEWQSLESIMLHRDY